MKSIQDYLYLLIILHLVAAASEKAKMVGEEVIYHYYIYLSVLNYDISQWVNGG